MLPGEQARAFIRIQRYINPVTPRHYRTSPWSMHPQPTSQGPGSPPALQQDDRPASAAGQCQSNTQAGPPIHTTRQWPPPPPRFRPATYGTDASFPGAHVACMASGTTWAGPDVPQIFVEMLGSTPVHMPAYLARGQPSPFEHDPHYTAFTIIAGAPGFISGTTAFPLEALFDVGQPFGSRRRGDCTRSLIMAACKLSYQIVHGHLSKR
jgi:hypothetical protein